MKTMSKTLLIATALVGGTAASPAFAATSITGSLSFAGGSTNYYDPGNGYVPAGYGNTAGTTVPVGNGIEFGFRDGSNLDTADFTENSVILSDVVTSGAGSWTQTFNASTAGFFNNTSLTSSNFVGLTYLVTGDTLRVDWAGTRTPGTYSAKLSFGNVAAVPEPAVWLTMLLGFGMLGATMRRRSRSTKMVYAL